MRKRDIPKAQGFSFAWSAEDMMHAFQGRAAGLKAAQAEDAKRRELREEMEPAWELAHAKGKFAAFPTSSTTTPSRAQPLRIHENHPSHERFKPLKTTPHSL